MLAELLPGDSISASQSDPLMMLPADVSRLPYPTAPKFKRQVGPLAVLKSPWFWTALVWLVFAVLLLFVLLRPTSSGKPRDQRPVDGMKRTSLEMPSKHPGSTSSTSGSTGKEQTETPLSSAPKDESWSEIAKRPTDQPVEEPAPESTPFPSKKEPAPKEPAPEPTPSAEPATPNAEPKETPPKSEKPAAPKTIDPKEMLAGVKKVSVQFQSSDSDPQSTLNLTIKRQALDALKQLGIEVEEKDPPVLLIKVSISKAADSFTVVIAAGVFCPDPHNKPLLVWKQSKQVVSMPAQRVRQDQLLRMLRLGAKDFFDRFVDDVRQARINAKTK